MSFFLENRALWAVILHPIFFKKKFKIYHLTLIFSNIYLIFYLPPLKPVTIYDPLKIFAPSSAFESSIFYGNSLNRYHVKIGWEGKDFAMFKKRNPQSKKELTLASPMRGHNDPLL